MAADMAEVVTAAVDFTEAEEAADIVAVEVQSRAAAGEVAVLVTRAAVPAPAQAALAQPAVRASLQGTRSVALQAPVHAASLLRVVAVRSARVDEEPSELAAIPS